jgi:hypothetical protein
MYLKSKFFLYLRLEGVLSYIPNKNEIIVRKNKGGNKRDQYGLWSNVDMFKIS